MNGNFTSALEARELAVAIIWSLIPPKEELDAYNAGVNFIKSAHYKPRPQTYSPEVHVKRKRDRPPKQVK